MLLRQALLFLSRRKDLETILKNNPVSRQACRRFVAGDTREEAFEAARALQEKGFAITFDYLGEEITDLNQATGAAEESCAVLEASAAMKLNAGVSVKLSHLGVCLNEEAAFENLMTVVRKGAELNRFVRVDMEGSDLTDKTLAMVRRCHEVFPNVGTVIQSCLRRSDDDLIRLMGEKIPVRLVKGAYLEPENLAFQQKEEVDLHYMRLTERLIHSGNQPAFATHDQKLIDFAIDLADIFGIEKDWYEFQMLYGIRRDIQDKLLQDGYRVRIYLPYGEDWYGYFMRRLAERPANLFFFLKNIK